MLLVVISLVLWGQVSTTPAASQSEPSSFAISQQSRSPSSSVGLGVSVCQQGCQGTCAWVNFKTDTGLQSRWCVEVANEGNLCDTFGYFGSSWPLSFKNFWIWLDDGTTVDEDSVRVQLFNNDYCTSGYFREFTPGTWFWDTGTVRSARVFVKQASKKVLPGVGLKVVVFPLTNMAPYDEFTCEGNQWQDIGLQQKSNAQKGNWPNACASADDRIYCLSPTHENYRTRHGDPKPDESTSAVNQLIGPPPGYLDFGGQYGPGSVAYTFNAYPLGSVYVNLYKSSWGPGEHGAACAWGHGKPAYDVCTDHHYHAYCVTIRFWEDGCPNQNNWDQTGWWQAKVKVHDLCNSAVSGWCFNTFGDGARQQGSTQIQCENAKILNQQGVAYTSWPLKATCMYTRIIPCDAGKMKDVQV